MISPQLASENFGEGLVRVLVCSAVSYSLRPHGLQLTRLLCPWDAPGNDTRVGCHFPPPGDLPDPGIEPASPVSPSQSH